MRKIHRWLAPTLALFLMIIGVTGIAIQATELIGDTPKAGKVVATQSAPVDQTQAKPEGKSKERGPMKQWNHFMKEIHSGEYFGPFGIIINIVAGVALLFFAVSGMWMYLSMYARRQKNALKGMFW
jgi:uncharacterized iron-regulated membrane protein